MVLHAVPDARGRAAHDSRMADTQGEDDLDLEGKLLLWLEMAYYEGSEKGE